VPLLRPVPAGDCPDVANRPVTDARPPSRNRLGMICRLRTSQFNQAKPSRLAGTSRKRLAQAELCQDFLRGTSSLFGGTFHITLEIHRRMFSREEYVLLAHGLVTGKSLVLTDSPI
jgi:hypothetical protein